MRIRFKLAAGLGEPWSRDGGIHQGCPQSMMFMVAFYVKRIPPDTAIHELMATQNDKYTFNIFIETIVDNNKNDTTHMDMRNMQN